MISTISRILYVHDPTRPPGPGNGLDVKIQLLNSKYISIENWQKGDTPHFDIKIAEPHRFELSDSESSSIEIFVDDLILSCNLVLRRVVFSRHHVDSTRSVVIKATEPSPKSTVEEYPNLTKITLYAKISISDSVHVTHGFEDQLNECLTLNLLSKIRLLNGNKTTDELSKSLDAYRSAMSSFDLQGIFKNLYIALELAINADEKDRSGEMLDQESERITGTVCSKMKEWRNLNNRLKHSDINPTHKRQYQEGLPNLGKHIRELRAATQKAITYRLTYVRT